MRLLKIYKDLWPDWRYILHHFYENRLVWWILKLIPKNIKMWIVVQAAVRAANGGSPDVTYSQMYEVFK